MARKGEPVTDLQDEGKQNLDFPMAFRSNQSLLIEESKSKFEGIDHWFDTFEHLSDKNFYENPVPKPVIPNSDAQIICRQISDVLRQWTS